MVERGALMGTDRTSGPGGPNALTLEDRLHLLQFRTFGSSHLDLEDPLVCVRCAGRPCTTVCPAEVYTWLEQDPGGAAGRGRLIVAYENCLECGACRIACPERNIRWAYPQGDYGVSFRYG